MYVLVCVSLLITIISEEIPAKDHSCPGARTGYYRIAITTIVRIDTFFIKDLFKGYKF
jgi:hypothetical protein